MTNADCIRRMSDDQLYDFLSEWECGDIDYSVTFCDLCNEATKRGEVGNVLNLDCDGCRKHWLQRDAVEYGGLMYWKRNTVFDTADRKTENNSEIPNNCKAKNYCDDCLYTDTCDSKEFFYACTSKATISKMEQVEDETRLTAKCLNCNNAKACKEKHWDGCVYEPKDEKTCETCRHWKYIAHEWQCEACKCQGYEPKDEPQTCEDCKHNGEKHAYDYACDKCTDMDKFQHEDEPQTERNE